MISAPSGGGKTSLIKSLLEKDKRVSLSVSYTTRAPRPGEINGAHYYFVDQHIFSELIARDALLEHADVFGNRYGTSRDQVEEKLAAGKDVLLDIDWQGARQTRESFPSCCTIFIVPPSMAVLLERLTSRGQDTEQVIAQRMNKARAEISHWSEFDYLIINDDFDEALKDLQSIVRHGKLNRPGSRKLYNNLLAELLENR